MKKYRQTIMTIIDNNREMLEEDMNRRVSHNDTEVWGDIWPELKRLLIDEFRRRVLFPLLTPYLRQQWYANHCTIDEHLIIHGDDDDYTPSPIDNLPVLEMPCAIFENNSIYKEITDNVGLYFIGMVGINPLTKQTYYLVKIGASEDCERRVNQYASYNPMLFCSKCICPGDNTGTYSVAECETIAHNILASLAYSRAQKAKEWFYVDEKTYFNLCNLCTTDAGWNSFFALGGYDFKLVDA